MKRHDEGERKMNEAGPTEAPSRRDERDDNGSQPHRHLAKKPTDLPAGIDSFHLSQLKRNTLTIAMKAVAYPRL